MFCLLFHLSCGRLNKSSRGNVESLVWCHRNNLALKLLTFFIYTKLADFLSGTFWKHFLKVRIVSYKEKIDFTLLLWSIHDLNNDQL